MSYKVADALVYVVRHLSVEDEDVAVLRHDAEVAEIFVTAAGVARWTGLNDKRAGGGLKKYSDALWHGRMTPLEPRKRWRRIDISALNHYFINLNIWQDDLWVILKGVLGLDKDKYLHFARRKLFTDRTLNYRIYSEWKEGKLGSEWISWGYRVQ